MARVDKTLSTRDRNIFASVFSNSILRPPKKQKIDTSTTDNINDVRAILRDVSRHALGIGDDDFECGIRSDLGDNERFCSLFFRCPSLSHGNTPSAQSKHDYISKLSKLQVWRELPAWRDVFGVTVIEKHFAITIDGLITEFITWSYANTYDNSVLLHLRFWTEHILYCYVTQFRMQLHDGQKSSIDRSMLSSTLSRWQHITLTRLADLRISELFDIVVAWDATSLAVDDLRQYTSNPATRSYLTTQFATVLSQRLLHPGASTIEILQIYISMIKSFRKLDPKGILLERVARKLRRYLRDREDTIKVVVAGLLSDVVEESQNRDPDVLHELALELQQREHGKGQHGDNTLDWNNMDWMPDPIDAAPDYMKSTSTDVVGSLVSLFESKDIFVKELQTMLADRLLRNKPDFDQEIGVIEHLKIRFGDTALQGCEVMLRDVLDSRKVDQVIKQDQQMNTETAKDGSEVQLHTKILSRLFWPSLQEQTFKVPASIKAQQDKYEQGFESLKQSRKLTWLNAIGQVEVELELEDRVFHEEVLPWQASIIYAFDTSGTDVESSPTTKSITTLSHELEMPVPLVRSACLFWTSKQILQETSRDLFTVLETLPDSSSAALNASAANTNTNAAAQAAAADAAAAQAAKQAEEAERKAKMAMYNQFIISMLTNGGAMPLPKIAMMLGIVVPGGFPFGNEELREFLSGMVREGVLEMGAGGAYKAVT